MTHSNSKESHAIKNVIVTGAGGMLGKAFVHNMERFLPGVNLYAFAKKDLNVADEKAVLGLERLSPEIIIHCAAIVNADFCESNYDYAYETMVKGTAHVVDLAQRTGAKVVYPQSFLVFDGKELPITEETKPRPLSRYGELKLQSEQIIKTNLTDYLIVVMAGFFGGREKDKNFVGKIVPQIVDLIKEGKKSLEVGDRVWQPTYTHDLACNTLRLIQKRKKGRYCMSSLGETSFFELTVQIVKLLGLEHKIEIVKAPTKQFDDQEAAKRPSKAIMDNRRLNLEQENIQRPWLESLAEYLSDDYFKRVIRKQLGS